MSFVVKAPNQRAIVFVNLARAIDSACRMEQAAVWDVEAQSIAATTHTEGDQVYLTRPINGQLMQVNVALWHAREKGNVPLLKGDTALEQMGWEVVS